MKEVKNSYSVNECLAHDQPSKECLDDLVSFKSFLDSMTDKASKETHYEKLNDWSDPIFQYVHSMLKKYGFKNGDPEANSKNVNASFWWKIYSVVSNVIYSTNLKPEILVALHHSSAYDRNEALKKDIDIIIRYFIKFEPSGKYSYDVFYSEAGYELSGSTKGNNKKHAIENFKKQYGPNVIVKHLQRLSY